MKWIIYHCKDHTLKDWRCCLRLCFCILKVLNRILHSQSSQQGRSWESCLACSRETLVNHCAMPATRIQISNAPEERRIWFYEAQKMISVCYLFFEEKLHPKKIDKWSKTSRFQNGFQTLGFYSSKSLWAVSSTLSLTLITTTTSSGTVKLVIQKCLEGDLKIFIWVRKRAECGQRSSTVTMPTPDLTPALTTSVHTFLFPWSFFSFLCDLTSFDSSRQNLFHQNNFQFSNFILKYLGIKSRFQ